MCDPTALLDLVPGEGLLKRPSMDYNEYTYCYGGGRGGWHFLPPVFFPFASRPSPPRLSSLCFDAPTTGNCELALDRGTNEIFYRVSDCMIRWILYNRPIADHKSRGSGANCWRNPVSIGDFIILLIIISVQLMFV